MIQFEGAYCSDYNRQFRRQQQGQILGVIENQSSSCSVVYWLSMILALKLCDLSIPLGEIVT